MPARVASKGGQTEKRGAAAGAADGGVSLVGANAQANPGTEPPAAAKTPKGETTILGAPTCGHCQSALARELASLRTEVASVRTMLQAMWRGFERAGILAEGEGSASGLANLGEKLARIDRNVEAVAQGQYQLQQENEELRELVAAGHLQFVGQVQRDDFLALAYILALGSRKAAADALKIPHRSFYDRVQQWRGGKPAYRRMHRLVLWRKSVGRHVTVRLNESLQFGDSGGAPENPETQGAALEQIQQAGTDGREGLLRDLLQALENQNTQNWPAVRKELIGILREEVPQ